MSILLSVVQLDQIGRLYPHGKAQREATAKAAAIHAVQYLREPCSEHIWYCNEESGRYPHRYACPDCMKQIHEELRIQ